MAEADWLPACTAGDRGFRNRAKLVVGGSAGAVTLGILGPNGAGIDLRECAVHAPGITAVLPLVAEFLNATSLPPYDVSARSGELKFVHLTEAPLQSENPGPGALMLRIVGRTQRTLDVVRSRLSQLREAVPHAQVITVNLLPEHRAALEGEREEVLHGSTLPMRLDDVTLHLRPQSFFQTNTGVAQQLYRQIREWVDGVDPRSLWDLYCGVGGFALHCSAPGRDVVGVEVSPAAVSSAQRSAAEAHVDARFVAADATAFALGATPAQLPEMLIVNPPRRGIGSVLSQWIEQSELRFVVYSSCNPSSLATDLALMPAYRVRAARLFDMFPHTTHLEVAVLLERIGSH